MEWTQMQKAEFKKKLFDTAQQIREMVLSTSGSEEGINVVLTILASFACSINDANWRLIMDTVAKGVKDPNESDIEEIMRDVFTSIDKLRTFCPATQSDYVNLVKESDIKDDNDTFSFIFRQD